MAQSSGGDLIASLLPLVVLFGVFYFLIIRPQQKQHKQHKEMLESLTKGDKIVTSGGLIAEVQKVEQEFYTVKLNDDTMVRVAKDFVAKKYESEASA